MKSSKLNLPFLICIATLVLSLHLVASRDSNERGAKCGDKRCKSREICKLNTDGEEECKRCPVPCNYMKRWICASDNKTYDECHFRQLVICEERKDLTILSEGKCPRDALKKQKKTKIVCKEVEDTSDDDKTTQAPAVKVTKPCPKHISANFDPHCGSDGESYPNLSTMEYEACHKNVTIKSIYPAKCSKGLVVPVKTNCKDVKCKSNGNCVMKNGYAHCTCSRWCESSQKGPICGSDGKTYDNLCLLKFEGCLAKKDLKWKEGTCESVTPSPTPKTDLSMEKGQSIAETHGHLDGWTPSQDDIHLETSDDNNYPRHKGLGSSQKYTPELRIPLRLDNDHLVWRPK